MGKCFVLINLINKLVLINLFSFHDRKENSSMRTSAAQKKIKTVLLKKRAISIKSSIKRNSLRVRNTIMAEGFTKPKLSSLRGDYSLFLKVKKFGLTNLLKTPCQYLEGRGRFN